MTVRKLTYKPSKAIVGKADYDLEFSAMLYFMYRAGMLKAYPLNVETYPDTEETLEIMTVALLKMKLRKDLGQVESFQSRIIRK